MKNLGSAKHILGMSIRCDREAIWPWPSQEKYIEKIFDKFNMKNANSIAVLLGCQFKSRKNDLNETKGLNMKKTHMLL